MRCPDCNKFVGFDEADPEVNELEIDSEGHVSVNVRIVNTCADCSAELKEATFDLEADHSEEVKEHTGNGHELSVEETSSDRTCRSGYFKQGVFIPKGGRYAKTFYGVEVGYTITCSCGELSIEGSVDDEVQASGMEELV